MGHVEGQLRTALAERYAIERELGAGGMATVYLAQDLKHRRRVAVKVLRRELAAALGRERFLREIEIAAGLTHPHIVPLFDSGEAAGFLYYVMPYIEGESLRQRLLRETHLPVPEALEIAAQLGEALDYAHRAGIIHRDIKPENVLLQGGNALLADFGIAAAVTAAGGERLTETGLSLGTPEYMSPEQATGGQLLDARSDVYALGAVVYEMLVGEPPHTGPTPQAVMAKLLTERPTEIRVVRDTVPEGVERAVMRALNTLPVDRFATAGEFVEELQRPSPVATDNGRRLVWRRRVRVVVAIGALVTAALLAVQFFGSRPAAPTPVHTQLTFTGRAELPAISPDGRFLAYVLDNAPSAGPREAGRVMLQQLSTGEATQVGESIWNVRLLRFARDGTGLIYAADSSNRRSGVYWAPLLGGSSKRLSTANAFAQTVDGKLLLLANSMADSTLVIKQPSSGQAPADTIVWTSDHATPMAVVDEIDWGPDGRWLAVVSFGQGGPFTLSIMSLDGATRSAIITTDKWVRAARWSRRGDVLYYVSGPDLMKVRVNRRTGRPMGKPAVLLSGLPIGSMDLTDDATQMVYARGDSRNQLWTASLPQRPTGDSLALDRLRGATGFERLAVVSPDGRQIAFVRGELSRSDIFVQPLEGERQRRITSMQADMWALQWSPDGTQLALAVSASGGHALMVVSLADRTPRKVASWTGVSWYYPRVAWIRDTTIVYLAESDTSLSTALRLVNPTNGTERALRLPEGDSSFLGVVGSPDGNHLPWSDEPHDSDAGRRETGARLVHSLASRRKCDRID